MAPPVEARRALITGGSSGIGLAAARALGAYGWQLWLVGRNPDRLERAAAGLRAPADGDTVRTSWGDVTRPESLSLVRQEVLEAWGGLDAVVCAAGAFYLAEVAATDPAAFKHVVDTNLGGTFHTARAFLPVFFEQGSGHILAVGSIAARQAFPENGAYSASKFGLRGLMAVLAEEVTTRGVTISLIHPPATETPLWDRLPPETLDRFDRSTFLPAAEVGGRIAALLDDPPDAFNEIDLF